MKKYSNTFRAALLATVSTPLLVEPTLVHATSNTLYQKLPDNAYLVTPQHYLPVFTDRTQPDGDGGGEGFLRYFEAQRYSVDAYKDFAYDTKGKRRRRSNDIDLFSSDVRKRNPMKLLEIFGDIDSILEDGRIPTSKLHPSETIQGGERLSSVIALNHLVVNKDALITLSLSGLPQEANCVSDMYLLQDFAHAYDLKPIQRTGRIPPSNTVALPFPSGEYRVALKTTCQDFDKVPGYGLHISASTKSSGLRVANPDITMAPSKSPMSTGGDLRIDMLSLPPLHGGLLSEVKSGRQMILSFDMTKWNDRLHETPRGKGEDAVLKYKVANGFINLLREDVDPENSDDLDLATESKHFKMEIDTSVQGLYQFMVVTKTNLTDTVFRKHPYVAIRDADAGKFIINRGATVASHLPDPRNYQPKTIISSEQQVAFGSLYADTPTRNITFDLIPFPANINRKFHFERLYDGYRTTGRRGVTPMYNRGGVFGEIYYGKKLRYTLPSDSELCQEHSPCLANSDNTLYHFESGKTPMFMNAQVFIKGPKDTDFVPLNENHLAQKQKKQAVSDDWFD